MPDADYRNFPTRPEYKNELAQFVSLGINCELGLVQRHCDIEPLGLFRFGVAPLEGLIQGLECRFDGPGDVSQIDVEEGFGGEYLAIHRRYGFEFHTLMNAAKTTRQDVLATVVRHYPFLAEMLLHELSEGKKLFVCRPETPDEPIVRVYHLLRAMRRIGPATLLWVTALDDPAVVGTTHWILPDQLMVGHLDRYGPLRFAAGLSFEPWLQVCFAALRLRAASRRRP
jgi:hypothetical protein